MPQVRPGRSLIRIRAFGLNHSEIFTRQGLSPSVTFPRTWGIGCTGGIAETTDPERLPRGQKAVSLMGEMGRAFDGSYAGYALVPNGQIYPAASDLPWEKPAAIPETGYTAHGSIQSLKVEDADHVLVRGATSSVGIAAARLLVAAHPALDLAARHGTSQRTSCCVTLAADASLRTGTVSFRRTGTSTRSSSSSALPPCAIPSPTSRKAASAAAPASLAESGISTTISIRSWTCLPMAISRASAPATWTRHASRPSSTRLHGPMPTWDRQRSSPSPSSGKPTPGSAARDPEARRPSSSETLPTCTFCCPAVRFMLHFLSSAGA